MSDIVDAKWARRAVERVEVALSDWNARSASRMCVVWGYANGQEAAEEATYPIDCQQQEGLLNWCGFDFELLICKGGDPVLHPNRCIISTQFPEPLEVPLTARGLFNVLKDCEDNVHISICPDASDLVATGMETMLPVRAITWRTLCDALSRLRASHCLVENRLAGNEGDDHWTLWGGDEPD
jgi:hypothetical protein